ncbi:MAG: CBS domain-containing protein [Planctomycetota bacterium]
MLICPYCDAEVIEGADACDTCLQPLTEMFISVPASSVERALMRDTVNELATRPHGSVPIETPVGEVLRSMVDSSVGCVTVLDDTGRLAGIFSERDAVLRIGPSAAEYAHLPIARFMTPNPTVIEAGAKIAHALQLMDVGGYRHLPVIDDDRRPVKMISIRDILAYLTSHSSPVTQ